MARSLQRVALVSPHTPIVDLVDLALDDVRR